MIRLAQHMERACHLGSDPPQAMGIVQSLGEGFGFAQVIETPLEAPEGQERIA